MFNYCPNCGVKAAEKKEDFRCRNCGKSFYQNSKPTATVIPIYNNAEILVAVRAHEPQKGMYDFIGGFLNNGEDPVSGAVRELKEETGLRVDGEKLKYLGIWIDKYEFESRVFYTFNVIYILPIEEKVKVEAKDDVAELVWVKLNDDVEFAFKSQDQIFKQLKEGLSA